ncbi:MAG: TIM barrel protein [Vicinamibacterales bacterium]
MKRRDFLIGAAASAATVAGVSAIARAQAGSPVAVQEWDKGSPAQVSPAKLARVSIMTYNFTSMLKLEGQPDSPARILNVFDLPQLYADTYGVHNIEFQHSHFASTETSYLKDLRARIEKAKSQMTQINVEFGQMTFSAPDPVQRYQAIDLTMRWVDHAVTLNCPRIMVNQGQLTTETKANALAALRAMGDYGKSKGVKISVETRVVNGGGGNRGRVGGFGGPAGAPAAVQPTAAPAPQMAAAPSGLPLSAPGGPPAWVLVKEVVEATGTYSNVDVGNIQAPDQASLHSVIKGLFPTSSGNMHMKVSPNWDLPTAIRFTNNELGYKGLYSIEVNPPLIRGVYTTILENI